MSDETGEYHELSKGPWKAVRRFGTYRFWSVVRLDCDDPRHPHPVVASRLTRADAEFIAKARNGVKA